MRCESVGSTATATCSTRADSRLPGTQPRLAPAPTLAMNIPPPRVGTYRTLASSLRPTPAVGVYPSPAVASVHEAPPSVLVKTPCSAATNNVEGSAGSTVSPLMGPEAAPK